MEIHGFCEEKFLPLKDAFCANFDEGLELGASLALTHQGKLVVDLWGGWAHPKLTRAWERDTIVNVYSTTKIMTIICTLILIDRGRLDLDAPIARYWPEFAQGGKAGVTVRDALTHQAGVPGFDPRLTFENLRDWNAVVDNLAAQRHQFGSERRVCYHAVTYGFLLGEIIRRVDGRRPAQFFREEIAEKAGIDFQIALGSASDLPRVAATKVPSDAFSPLGSELRTYVLDSMVAAPDSSFESQAIESPASSGIGNGRSIARACAVLATGGELDGTRCMSRAIVEEAAREQVFAEDPFMGWISLGLGLGLDNPLYPAPSPSCFHWGGYGGSWGVMDLQTGVSLGYAPNNLVVDVSLTSIDPRLSRLSAALGTVLPRL